MTELGRPISASGQVATFLDVDFDLVDMDQTIEWIAERIAQKRFTYIVTPNVDHIVRLNKGGLISETFKRAYNGAGLLICDSRVLSRFAKMSNVQLTIVPGSDLTAEVVRRGGVWKRIAVVGGDDRLHQNLVKGFPGYDWIFHEPPFGVLHNPEARGDIRRFVEEAEADIIFFAIGAPQSELCCLEILEAGKARGVGLCIGASLEFLTGAKPRAPKWMQRAGMEWLYRLNSEPTRLYRRYLIDGPRIISIWWKSRD